MAWKITLSFQFFKAHDKASRFTEGKFYDVKSIFSTSFKVLVFLTAWKYRIVDKEVLFNLTVSNKGWIINLEPMWCICVCEELILYKYLRLNISDVKFIAFLLDIGTLNQENPDVKDQWACLIYKQL